MAQLQLAKQSIEVARQKAQDRIAAQLLGQSVSSDASPMSQQQTAKILIIDQKEAPGRKAGAKNIRLKVTNVCKPEEDSLDQFIEGGVVQQPPANGAPGF